jgi:hypothetical protein
VLFLGPGGSTAACRIVSAPSCSRSHRHSATHGRTHAYHATPTPGGRGRPEPDKETCRSRISRPRRPCPCRLLAQRAARLCSGTDPALGRVNPARATYPCLDSCLPSRPCSVRPPLPLLRFMSPPSSTPTTSAPLRDIELRAGVELRVNEPPFVQAASRCYAESACCNSMF